MWPMLLEMNEWATGLYSAPLRVYVHVVCSRGERLEYLLIEFTRRRCHRRWGRVRRPGTFKLDWWKGWFGNQSFYVPRNDACVLLTTLLHSVSVGHFPIYEISNRDAFIRSIIFAQSKLSIRNVAMVDGLFFLQKNVNNLMLFLWDEFRKHMTHEFWVNIKKLPQRTIKKWII